MTKPKYILLDFDGVLTSEANTQKCVLEYRQENLFGVDWFDPACVDALAYIIEQTKAKVVICSSWRDLGETRLKKLWDHNHMPGTLDEQCPTTPEWILTKKESIQHWISQHQNYQYIILDDDNLGLINQIKTNIRTGLTMENAKEAVKLLNQQKNDLRRNSRGIHL